MNDSYYSSFQMTESSITETRNDSEHSYGDIYDLADAFLSIESMTHKKLQKLCYYAKAWYLALNDRNIIEEPFEAWVHGAVQPRLYQKYRGYGFQPIPMYNESGNLPEEFLSFAREIYESYGDFTGDQLEKMNHAEQPWQNARVGLKPWQNSSNIISEDDMKAYFRGLMSDEQ